MAADTLHTCARCRKDFTERRNLGKLQCSQHPGVIQTGPGEVNRFSCCGLDTHRITCVEHYYNLKPEIGLQVGCVKCDHSTTLSPFTEDGGGKYTFPLRMAQSIYPGTHLSNLNNFVIRDTVADVYRFDYKSSIYKVV